MLKAISKISYKFSTNAIFILFSIFADQVLSSDEFGKFTVLLAIQILIFNISDVFNSKFLLGKFSSFESKGLLSIIFAFKVRWSLLFVSLLSLLFFIYEFSWQIIILLICINYVQILSSTISTYIFSSEKSIKLFLSNAIGSIFCFIYLFAHYIVVGKYYLNSLVIGILIYRLAEIIFLLSSYKKNITFSKSSVSKQFLVESVPFYLQLVLSVISTKLFVFFLPLVLTYEDISLIGTFEYLISIPLFFISVITMSSYTELFHHKLDTDFNLVIYRKILKKFYFKAFGILCFFMTFQIIYIFLYKSQLIDFVLFLVLQSFTVVFTSIQGYILFFWKMNRMIIYISILTLFLKNTLMLILIINGGVLGYFITTLSIDIIILLFIRYKVQVKLKQKTLNENSFFAKA